MNWSSSDTAGDGTASVLVSSVAGVVEGALVDAIVDALVVARVERRVVVARDGPPRRWRFPLGVRGILGLEGSSYR